MMEFIRRLVAFLTVLAASPLLAKLVERWLDKAGYLDDPSKGVHLALSTLAAIAEQAWFYPALTGILGFGLGLIANRIGTNKSKSLASQHRDIGYRMQEMAQAIQQRERRSLNPWPDYIGDLAPRLESLFIEVAKVGIVVPGPDIARLNDDGHLLLSYLQFVGTMLADGHTDAAIRQAVDIVTESQAKALRSSEQKNHDYPALG